MSMPIANLDPPALARLAALVSPRDRALKSIPVRAPFTGEVLGEIPACGEADAALAVARARAAQPAWAALSFSSRSRILLRFHDLLLDRQHEILDLIQMETGKARRHAFEEILDTAVVSRYYALHARSILRPRRRKGALPLLTRTMQYQTPVGVVAFLIPWNYPLNLALTDALPALMAGNTGVLKPDPQTSFTALWSVALLREAGLPAEVLPVVTGEGSLVGPALVEQADYVMFTGSCATGRVVGRQAAARLIGCSLELGGKNPMLVLDDADLERAVDGAVRGCFAGAGQVCISIERIFVHQSLFEGFTARLAERARNLKLGTALDYSVEMGSLTSERQLRSIEEHVADALQKGATLVAGGRRRPDLGPLFYEPTILTNLQPGMKAYAGETFGPVVAIYPFATEDQAVEMANGTPYGLSASIWTRNPRRGQRLAGRLRTGSVNINEAYAAAWGSVDSPIGGMKESGLRPRHGEEGILKYTVSQTVATQRFRPIAPAYGEDPRIYARWMTRLLRLVKRTRVMG